MLEVYLPLFKRDPTAIADYCLLAHSWLPASIINYMMWMYILLLQPTSQPTTCNIQHDSRVESCAPNTAETQEKRTKYIVRKHVNRCSHGNRYIYNMKSCLCVFEMGYVGIQWVYQGYIHFERVECSKFRNKGELLLERKI